MDEVLTPDSSRFWPVESYREGNSPPSYDKQYLRDWLETVRDRGKALGQEGASASNAPDESFEATGRTIQRGLRIQLGSGTT